MVDQYAKLGVDSGKGSVRKAFKRIIDNDFPGAFVNIVHDPLMSGWVMTMHNDGDGSKSIQRLLHFSETGDESVLRGMADDALSMNTADIAAAGFVFGNWCLTDVLNTSLLPEHKRILMENVAERLAELVDLYRRHSLGSIFFLGGETADLPDQVGSSVFDVCVHARMTEDRVIRGKVQPGDRIYGLASDGFANWESARNSGLMANGLTLARSALMSSEYDKKYPNLKRDGDFFRGRFKIGDKPDGLGMEVSEAIMSPTRQWAIVIGKLLRVLEENGAFDLLHGISVNTGGGATKICHVGRGGISYVKTMPTPPPIFRLIQSEAGEEWRNMFKTFNCGVGLDIVADPDQAFSRIMEEVSADTGIRLYELGECEAADGENRAILNTEFGVFDDY